MQSRFTAASCWKPNLPNCLKPKTTEGLLDNKGNGMDSVQEQPVREHGQQDWVLHIKAPENKVDMKAAKTNKTIVSHTAANFNRRKTIMAYQLYRNTTLGNSLQESLDELIQTQQITPQLALQVLLQFDKAINTALANRVRNRVNFRGSLNTYRFCDNVWTFVLNDVEFREVTDLVKVDKVKIVACDGKNTGSNATE
ncbi:transcription initiation factor IIA subunit 2-like [Scleropages formosus]|uniref:Transcription initiation factor IIA subunit 2 n=3 Tax=Osteoglossocephalai TaxID=1489341 RepID=A0A0P7VNR8_SCLFO|nr:transcription initiation factor IIA subunit 2-like [Scleropages formosus]